MAKGDRVGDDKYVLRRMPAAWATDPKALSAAFRPHPKNDVTGLSFTLRYVGDIERLTADYAGTNPLIFPSLLAGKVHALRRPADPDDRIHFEEDPSPENEHHVLMPEMNSELHKTAAGKIRWKEWAALMANQLEF